MATPKYDRTGGEAFARFQAGEVKTAPLFWPNDRTIPYDEFDLRHGKLASYTRGCRCSWCKLAGKAHRDAKKIGLKLPKHYNARFPEEL